LAYIRHHSAIVYSHVDFYWKVGAMMSAYTTKEMMQKLSDDIRLLYTENKQEHKELTEELKKAEISSAVFKTRVTTAAGIVSGIVATAVGIIIKLVF
jgi:hypothetical protein